MNIIAETRENIENWLGRKQGKAYKRMKGDNYQGYVYQLTLPDPNMDLCCGDPSAGSEYAGV